MAHACSSTADERLVADDTDYARDVYSRESDGSLRLLSDGTSNNDRPPPCRSLVSRRMAHACSSRRRRDWRRKTPTPTADVYSHDAGGALRAPQRRPVCRPRCSAPPSSVGVSPDGARVFSSRQLSSLCGLMTRTPHRCLFAGGLGGTLRLLSDGPSAIPTQTPPLSSVVSRRMAHACSPRRARDCCRKTPTTPSMSIRGTWVKRFGSSATGQRYTDPTPTVPSVVSRQMAHACSSGQTRDWCRKTDTAVDVYSRDSDGTLRLLSDGTLNPDPDDDASSVGSRQMAHACSSRRMSSSWGLIRTSGGSVRECVRGSVVCRRCARDGACAGGVAGVVCAGRPCGREPHQRDRVVARWQPDRGASATGTRSPG